MKILGIDAISLLQGGGQNYIIELMRHADPLKSGFMKIIIWGTRETLSKIEDRPWLEKRSPKFIEINSLARFIWQVLFLGREARSSGCHLLFVTGGTYLGLFKNNVTVHQNLLPFDPREISRYAFRIMYFKLHLLRFTQRITFNKSLGIIFLSKHARQVVENYLHSSTNSIVIPHGISKRFAADNPKIQFPINSYNKENPFKILYVSTIDIYKNQKILIKAVGKLIYEKGWSIELLLVGPSYPPALRELMKNIEEIGGDSSWIKVLGSIEYREMPEIYKNADFCIWPSTCESFGMGLLEGMAAGLPFAASNSGTACEILKDSSVYFDSFNSNDISIVLSKILNDPNLRFRLADKSLKNVSSYSWSKCAMSTFEFFKFICSNKR